MLRYNCGGTDSPRVASVEERYGANHRLKFSLSDNKNGQSKTVKIKQGGIKQGANLIANSSKNETRVTGSTTYWS